MLSHFSPRGPVEGRPSQLLTTPSGRCRPNVTGRRCDACAPGFHGYPHCRPCDCHQAGSAPGVCDPVTGQCYCKVRAGGCPAASAEGHPLDVFGTSAHWRGDDIEPRWVGGPHAAD